MRPIVLLLTCLVPCIALLPDRKSKEDAPEPGTKITETRKGNFDQKLVIDHQKYGESGEAATERVDDSAEYAYPDGVQLVPNVPVSPQTPKYTLVPVKRVTVSTESAAQPGADDYDAGVDGDGDFAPTIPNDFQQEIANFRIPHLGLPGYITDPPPVADEDDDADVGGDDEEEVPNHDHLFADELLEPDEFKDDEAQGSSETATQDSDGLNYIMAQQEPPAPLVVATASPVGYHEEPEGYRQIHTTYESQNQQYHSHTPNFPFHAPPAPIPVPAPHPVRHYGSARPVPVVRVRTAYPVYRRQVRRPPRVVVRYPRQQRPLYYSPRPRHPPLRPQPHPYNRVRVMTQSYVQHPMAVPAPAPRPVMIISDAQLRASEMPARKKKKKAKGCKPKKIIKEIHFHHYDPQLSAQLAPLEGINLKDAPDYDNNIKVITKETDVEDMVKKGENDYRQHNANMEAEMNRHREETEKRLRQPEYYPDDYNPHYSDSGSGSREYIDYNIQTDSNSEVHEPHPSHDYPADRTFTKSNRSAPIQVKPGRYVKHKFVRYDIKTPDIS